MTAILYEFEGAMRTVSEVHARCSALSEAAVRKHLKAGRKTVVEIMSFDPIRASSEGARKAFKARGKPRVLSATINRERNR